MGVWADRVVPHIVEKAGSNPHVEALRDQVCEGLHGRLLEIGFGSGLNVAHYPATVTSVHAVEPSDVGWRLSEDRRASAAVPIERSGLDGAAARRAGRVGRLCALDVDPLHDPRRAPRADRGTPRAAAGRPAATSSSTDSRRTPRWRPGSGA